MQAKRPTIFDEVADDRFKIIFHYRHYLRARFQEVLEICRRKGKHFACAVHAEERVTLLGRTAPAASG